MIIDLPRFVASERPSWNELEAILKRIQDNEKSSFTLEEAQRFHFLYQKASADLGQIDTFASEPELRGYLESLVGRAYSEIHETRGRVHWRWISWFTQDFPQVFRRNRGAFWLSFIVTMVGVLFGGFAVLLDPEAKDAIVPGQFSHVMGRPSDRVAREEKAKSDRLGGHHATFAGQLMTNNIGVSIKAMAFGLIWGIGSILLLFYNGVILGLVLADYIADGQTIFVLGWLLPHGVIEIPSILIAGQAGLMLGRAVIGRGDRESLGGRLRAVSRDVTVLVGGLSVMLVWAGLMESFLSQHHQPVLPYWMKIGFGLVELALLIWFLGWAGRSSEKAARTTSPVTFAA